MKKSIFLYLTLFLIFSILIKKNSAQNPTLPSLPESFYSVVEITHELKNETQTIEEYYDKPAQKGMYKIHSGSHTEIHLVYFDQAKIYQMFPSTKKCNIINVPTKNNTHTLYMPTTSEIFHFGNNFDEEYQGITKVRGIYCDYWKEKVNGTTKIQNLDYSFTLHHYFSVDDWKIKGFNENRIPIKSTMEGVFNGTNIKRTINYVNFEKGEFFDEKLSFWTPADYCEEQFPDIDYPTFPDIFSMDITSTLPSYNTTFEFSMYYNKKLDKYRRDTNINGNRIEEYYDLKQHNYYKVDLSERTCEMKTIVQNPEWLTDPETHSHLLSPVRLFQFGPEYNETYYGKETIRGIKCDKWKRIENNGQYKNTYYYYFSSKEWKFSGQETLHQIPILVKVKSEYPGPNNQNITTYFYSEISNFNADKSVPSLVWKQPHYCHLSESPSIPSLPERFVAEFSLVDLNKTRSFNIKELFDYNREKFSIGGEIGKPKTETYIFQSGNKGYSVQNYGASCTYFSTSKFTSHGLPSVMQTFQWGEKYAKDEIYEGKTVVRGIKADHWSRKFYGTFHRDKRNLNYTIDHYFADKDWQFFDRPQEHQIPLRIIIKGKNYQDTSLQSDEYDVNFHIEVINFHYEMHRDMIDSEFDLPPSCPGVIKFSSYTIYFGLGILVVIIIILTGVIGSSCGLFTGFIFFEKKLGRSKSSLNGGSDIENSENINDKGNKNEIFEVNMNELNNIEDMEIENNIDDQEQKENDEEMNIIKDEE